MHVCIVGTGAAGWIACNYLKTLDIVEKITIVGSSKIPPIGVGESNVKIFLDFLSTMIENSEFTLKDFIVETDAAIKYGVMYENWSKENFLHYFKTENEFDLFQTDFGMYTYGRSLANKEKSVHVHDLMGNDLFTSVKNNDILINQSTYNHSYHFDAAKFINFFHKNALKSKKVSYIDDEVLGGLKKQDLIKYIQTKNNNQISADFYIFATGDYKINEKFLEIKYKDYSNILLTNKAAVFPLKYKNKTEEFFPYTVARAMDFGWRWITPTWSRIGTGYVFSSNHVSEDRAIEELKDNVGNKNIEPFIVDFYPKHNQQELHENWATIGMASGFLEPLDAPGLSMTINSIIYQISYYLNYISIEKDKEKINFEIDKINDVLNQRFDFWCMFILSQYKTCHKNNTSFWIDHKNVKWEKYDNFIKNLDEHNPHFEKMMFYQTMAGKNIQWKTSLNVKPYKTGKINYEKINHLEYISSLHNEII